MRYLPQDYNLVKGFTGINGLNSVDTFFYWDIGLLEMVSNN